MATATEVELFRVIFDKLYLSFRWYYIHLVIFANTPFLLEIRDKNLRAKLGKIFYISRIVVLCLTFPGVGVIIFTSIKERFSVVVRLILIVIVTLLVLLGLIAVVTDKYEPIINYLKQLAETDLMLKINGFKLNEMMYEKASYRNKLTFWYSTIVAIVMSASLSLSTHYNYISISIIGVVFGSKAIFKYLFALKMLEMKSRFEIINEAIINIPVQKPICHWDILSVHNFSKEIIDKLYYCCRIHYRLCSILRKVTQDFHLLIFVAICSTIFTTMHSIFMVYHSARNRYSEMEMINSCVWVMFQSIELFILILACADTCDCANKTPVLLHKLRNKAPNLNIEDHIQMYSLQLLHQKVRISVGKLLDIDYPLIFSLIGGFVTYTILLIQFEIAADIEPTKITEIS